MKPPFVHKPFLLGGMWLVCGASLALAVAGIVQAWRRPVSAISGIAPLSDVFSVGDGVVQRTLTGRYADLDLRIGDRIVQVGERSWEHTQRLNFHELPDLPIGSVFDMVVQRGDAQHLLQLMLYAPNAWEQTVMIRLSLAALALWVTPTILLITFSKVLRQGQHNSYLATQADLSSIPLWFLTWQAGAILQGLANLKYPVAVVWVDALLPLLVLFIGLLSVPYPLAPRHLRPGWLLPAVTLLGALYCAMVLKLAWSSPFPSSDWRRAIQLLRPPDALWQSMIIPNGIGIALAVGGITITAFSRQIHQLLCKLAEHGPFVWRSRIKALVQRFEAIYSTVPISIRVLAEFQSMIVAVFVVADFIPRWIGGMGGGYSVLFGIIPLSYLVLYSDAKSQQQAQKGMILLVPGIALLQAINVVYRVSNGSYGMAANTLDLISIVGIASVSVFGGLGIGIGQWRRNRTPPDPLQSALDNLFLQQNQDKLWQSLIEDVGPHLGCRTWLWLRANPEPSATEPWLLLHATPDVQDDWHQDPALLAQLEQLRFDRTASQQINLLALPSTWVLLPIARSGESREVLIAVNPQLQEASADITNELVLGRLMQAVQLVRSREHDKQLAEQRGMLNEVYRQITSNQREQTFRDNLRFSSMLHDHAMQQLAVMVQKIQQIQQSAPDSSQLQQVSEIEEQCRKLDNELRRVARELRPPGAGQKLRYTLEHTLMEWEQQHPEIFFDFEFPLEENGLDDFQRDSIFMIIDQLVKNALKHAQAQTIRIVVEEQQGMLVALVEDDGRGFDYQRTALRPGALGLQQRHDIAQELGGSLTITSRPGEGCKVRFEMPLPQASD